MRSMLIKACRVANADGADGHGASWAEMPLVGYSFRRLTSQHSVHAHHMRGLVLRGHCDAWEAGPRSAEQLREAATHFERAGALHHAPAIKAQMEEFADTCRRAEGILADMCRRAGGM